MTTTAAHHMILVSLAPISLVCISGLFQEINEVRCTIDIFHKLRSRRFVLNAKL